MIAEEFKRTFRCAIVGKVNPDLENSPAQRAANAMAEIFIEAIKSEAGFTPHKLPRIDYNEQRGIFNVVVVAMPYEKEMLMKIRMTSQLIKFILEAARSGSINEDSLLIRKSVCRVVIDAYFDERADFVVD